MSNPSAGNVRAARNAAKEILQKVDKAVRSTAGPKRWFWELLQNAIDSIANEPQEKVNVTVILKPGEKPNTAIMDFIHDGGPFKETKDELLYADDFENLISPVSGKSAEDKNTVGKFGTGFLSTHNLSLVIDVEGVLLTNEGERIKLSTSLDRSLYLDKSENYAKERINGIIEGLEAYDKMKLDKLPPETEKNITKFTYYLNDEESIKRVNTGFLEIEQSLPTVFALINRIESITIENFIDNNKYSYIHGDDYEYKKIEEKYISIQNSLKIDVAKNVIEEYSVATLKGEKVTLGWPINTYKGGSLSIKNARRKYKENLDGEMPILYCTFPLIGSDKVKFPVFVHSEHFTPNETRDGISLTKETITDKETGKVDDLDIKNRKLIEEAVDLYKQLIKTVASNCDNLFYIAKVNKKAKQEWIDPKWFLENVSTPLRSFLSHVQMIDISNSKCDRKSILDEEDNIQVFFPSISNGNEPKRKKRLNQKFYIFCKQLFEDKIPIWKDLHKWHEVLWSDKEVIKTLEIKDIVQEIDKKYKSIKELSTKLNISADRTLRWLNQLYALIDELKQQKLYEDYEIIPNQKGIFKTGDQLRSEAENSKIEPEFICILRRLNPERDLFQKLVDRKVNCEYNFQEKSLKENIGPEINKLLKETDESGYYTLFNDRVKAVNIIQRLLSFSSFTEKENTNKSTIFNYSQEVFGSMKQRKIAYFQDFDTTNTIKHMMRLINEEISDSTDINGLSDILDKEETETIDWLNSYLNFQIKSSDFENLIHWADIIPNQYKKFKAHGESKDREKMFCPYVCISGSKDEVLDKTIIDLLKLLSKEKEHDWKQFLVLDGVELHTLPPKRWSELGPEIDTLVSEIASNIFDEDSDKIKDDYYENLLSLLTWCEKKENQKIASEHLDKTYAIKDKLYLQLTYSPETVAVLKDKKTLNVAKKIKESSVTAGEVEETLSVLENMKSKLGNGAISEFIRKAETFIEVQEKFNNRLETGQNIEDLLREALEKEGIKVDVDKSGRGAYDIKIWKKDNPLISLKLEVKSYKYGSTFDFKFANSQIIEANQDISNYIVCTLERKPNDDICDIEYLRQNLKVQPHLGKITEEIYPIVKEFDNIYKASKYNQIPLEIPCIEEPRVIVNQIDLLTNVGKYNDLIEIIKLKLT